MKTQTGVLLFCCVAHLSGCAAGRDRGPSGRAHKRADFPGAAVVTLGDPDGRMQLTMRSVRVSAQPLWAAVVGLRAYGEDLLGIPAAGSVGGLWLDGKAVSLAGKDGPHVVEQQSSNEWTYAVVDMAPLSAGHLKDFKRHLLLVKPDLFVVCDEIRLGEPAVVEIGWCFPSGVDRDSARQEWRVQQAGAGLTARILGTSKAKEPAKTSDQPVPPSSVTSDAVVWVRPDMTNKTVEFRQIAVFVPHAGETRRSLAFKLLESDTAIGVRVHRDGLPTLVAIRKLGVAEEANLTGLKFVRPVAVDVFHPRRK